MFDVMIFYLQGALTILTIYSFKLPSFTNNITQVTKLLLVFGPAHTLFSYLLSFGYNSSRSAINLITILYFLSGFLFPFCIKITAYLFDKCNSPIYQFIRSMIQLIPLYQLSYGLSHIIFTNYTH
jgi:hypothetical protein